MIRRKQACTVLAALGMLACSRAGAADAPAAEAVDPVQVDLTVTAVSDYRFRGVSLTSRKPALQVDFSVTHESGLYLSFFGSNDADNGGADMETDIGLGYATRIGKIDLDVYTMFYIYPGARAGNYAEFIGRASVQAGPLELGLNAAYAPGQDALGGRDNRYVNLDAALPIAQTPLSVTASFGIEDGAFASAKRDWSAGVALDLDRVTVGVTYVDTARAGGDPNARAGLFASVAASF